MEIDGREGWKDMAEVAEGISIIRIYFMEKYF